MSVISSMLRTSVTRSITQSITRPTLIASSSALSQQCANFATLPPQQRIPKTKHKKFFRIRGAYYAEPAPKPQIAKPQFDHIPGFIQRIDSPLPEGKDYYFDLQAYPRGKTGKIICHQLRTNRNHIPAVIFDRNNPRDNTVTISLERSEVEHMVRSWQEPCAMTRVGTITVQKDESSDLNATDATDSNKLSETRKPIPVMIGEINRHPVTQEILNITFITFSPKDHIKLSIPVAYINEAESLGYRRGALLLHMQHHIQVHFKGHHTQIPSRFVLNLMYIDLGNIIRATDLLSKLPASMKLVKPLEEWILINMQSIGGKRWVEDEEAAAAAAAAPAAGGKK